MQNLDETVGAGTGDMKKEFYDAANKNNQIITESDIVTDFSTIQAGLIPDVLAVNNHLINNIAALAEYFFYNTAHAIGGGYLQMKQPASTAIVADITNLSIVNGQTVAIFATNAGTPNITFIPNGLVKVNIHASKTASTKVVQLRALIYTRNLAGLETLICTTDDSSAIGEVNANYLLGGIIPANVIVLTTDIIVIKFVAVVTGAGVAVDLVLGVEDSTVSSLGLPYSVKAIAAIATTDNAIIRANGTTGILQNSGILIDDNDVMNLPKESNKGIFIDGAYGWDDLVGARIVQTTGVNAPTLETYKTGVLALGYNASDIQSWEFHLNHEEVIGGNKYLHVHTRHNGTGITGNLVITAVIAYNYGHNRAGSPSPITKTFTVTPAQMPQYETRIEDILIAQSGGGASLFDSDLWLPDDDILATFTVTTLPTITGGLSSKVFIPFCDIHRQVSGKSTKNAIPNFYGA